MRWPRAFDGAGVLRGILAGFLILCLAPPFSVAAAPPTPGPDLLRITRDGAEDLAPQVAVDAAGRATLVWLRIAQGRATLRRATAPDWTPTLLAEAEPPATAAAAPPLGLTPGPPPYVAWPQPVSGSTALYVVDLATGEAEAHLLSARPLAWTYTLDAAGRPHAAWAEGNAVYYWAQGQAVALAARTASAARVSDVALAVTPSGRAYLAWTGWDAADRPVGVYVGDAAGEEPVVLAAPGAASSRLLALGDEGLTLWTLSADGLRVATGDNWRGGTLVAPGVTSWEHVAPAADARGAAHLVWLSEGRLWHAESGDWALSRRTLGALAGPVEGLDLAVGADGALHVVWSAEGEIYYLGVDAPSPVLAFAAPRGDAGVVGPGLTARAVEIGGPAPPLAEVAFWAETAPAAGQERGLLYSLGIDTEPADDWSATVPELPLTAPGMVRIIALGIDAAGRVHRAQGEWFAYAPAGAPQVLVDSPGLAPLRGEAMLGVLVAGDDPAGAPVHLYVEDVAREGAPLALGAVEPQATWQRLPFDSRLLPDGEHRVVASTGGAAGSPYGVSDATIRVDNALAPAVEVTAPVAGQVLAEAVVVRAEAADLDGRVERVEFYLERGTSSGYAAVQTSEGPAPPAERLWLGSDTDGTDGWMAERPVEPALDGDGWVAWAVAYDDRGLSTAASAGPFTILGRQRPAARLVLPSPGSILRGTHPVTLHVRDGYPYLASARLYALGALGTAGTSGAGWSLGPLREEDGRWMARWDTTALPDGEYRLLAVGEDGAGRSWSVEGGPVRVANDALLLRVDSPAEGAEVQGPTAVRLALPPDAPAPEAVRLYRREPTGALAFLGEDLSAEGGWEIAWDTRRTPDGPCDLVILGWGPGGEVARQERRVTVRNASPAVGDLTVAPVPGEAPTDPAVADAAALRGMVQAAWEAEPAPGSAGPLATRLEYSPDGGRHWLLVAEDLGDAREAAWDTVEFPDAREGLLRVTVADGVHRASAVSAPFILNNVNERLHVSLLAPEAGASLAGEVRVAWAAEDPDGDPLTVRLDYRAGDGPWEDLPPPEEATGPYTWDTADLAPRGDYALRITAEDAAGAEASDVLEGLEIVDNAPPAVHLLAPRGDEPLRGEAVVLWSTDDPDGDPLAIDLYYSDNAGQTWLPLAEGLSDTGFYLWQFSFLPSGAAYRLRIVARDAHAAAADQSGLLSVDPLPTPRVAVHAPLPGQEVRGWFPVRWTVTPGGRPERRLSIVVRREGDDWQPLASDLDDTGLFVWDTTAFPDGAYELAVLSTHPDGGVARSASRTLTGRNGANAPPTVRLLSPLGGETWDGLREIGWEAADPDGDPLEATLSVSADAGRTWTALGTVDGRAGVYLWDTARWPDGGEWRVQVVVGDGEALATAKSSGVLRLANRRLQPPTVAFLAPDGDGVLGAERVVRWDAADPDGDPLTVALDLSADGGPWEELARWEGDAGEHPLGDLPHGPTYLLRLRASDGLYETAIVSAPLDPGDEAALALAVAAPEAGEVWSGLREARWEATHPEEREAAIDLALSADGGRRWAPVVEGFPNTGVYDLDTTAWPNGIYRLRITAHLEGEAAVAVGEAFRIENPGGHAPVVSLVAPRGGEAWAGAREVRWLADDPDGDRLRATLQYSLDRGATWQTLAEGQAGATSYVWDTTAAPNCAHVLLRVAVSDGRFAAQDAVPAPLAIVNPDRPTVALEAPPGEHWVGLQRLSWQARGPEAPGARVHLEVSLDGGTAWRTLAGDLPLWGSLWWDAASVPDGAAFTLRARLEAEGEDLALDVLPRTVTASGPR